MKTVNLKIDNFLGLHSDALGDTELKVGELASMQNFKITKNYNAEKRSGYTSELTNATTKAIQGQWYGVLNGAVTHLFASNGHIYKNNGDGSVSDLGTLTDAKTNFFQFEDTKGIVQREADASTRMGYSATEQFLGQTITPERNIKLTSATFLIRAKTTATDGIVSCKLYATVAGVPTTLIATASNTISGDTMTSTATLFTSCEFFFDSVQLTANAMYALVLSRSDAVSSTNYFEVASATTGTVCSGGTVVVGTSVPAWSTVDDDLWFKVSVKPEYSIYIQNGYEYKKWTGYGTITDVEGYVPIIMTGTVQATGVGITVEVLNSLTGKRRVSFNSIGGGQTVFQLPEKNISSVNNVYVYDIGTTTYTTDLNAGTVTITTAPNSGLDNVEIVYTIGSGQRTDITKRTNFELYGGKNDSRVFIYGNDATLSYSDLANGIPSAEYFPVLNYIRVGSNEFNINSLVKQYDRLIIFKEDTTWWSSYEYSDTLGASFPMYPLNDSIGCSVKGSGKLVQNNPYVIFNNQIYQFVASNVRDERNATLMSLRVQPLLDAETMTNAITFDNEEEGELWIILAKECYIYNYFLDVWYYYLFNDTVTSIIKTDKVTIGTSTGQLMKFDGTFTDNGTTITAFMETGFMNYGYINIRKFVNFMWISIKPDSSSTAEIYTQIDGEPEKLIKTIEYNNIDFARFDFTSLSFTTNYNPKSTIIKAKAKKFVYIKVKVKNNTDNTLAFLSITAPAILGGYSK